MSCICKKSLLHHAPIVVETTFKSLMYCYQNVGIVSQCRAAADSSRTGDIRMSTLPLTNTIGNKCIKYVHSLLPGASNFLKPADFWTSFQPLSKPEGHRLQAPTSREESWCRAVEAKSVIRRSANLAKTHQVTQLQRLHRWD